MGAQYFVSCCSKSSDIHGSAWFQCNWQNCTELSSGVFASTAADLDPVMEEVECCAMHPERMADFVPPTDGLIKK